MSSSVSRLIGPATRETLPAPDAERAPPGAVLFEVAWEVCNQVGGIYQVIRSKAPRLIERWRNRYWLVGPYVESKAALDFEARRPTGWIGGVVERLEREGVGVHHGRWLIPGRPKVLLLEHRLEQRGLNGLKYRLWNEHGIEFGFDADPLVDGVVGFGEAVRRLLLAASEEWCGRGDTEGDGATRARGPRGDRRVLAHFHEWMGGVAVPMVRREGAAVATVFQTHATLLGRYVASADEFFYDHLPFVNEAGDAARFGVRAQHGIERACAREAHVFTTVSQITGEECRHILGRPPDLVLPNGLNIDRYNVGHEFQTLHGKYKERISRFAMGHFFPAGAFDLDRTVYFFTSGRFEPRNKGFDLCLEAMARLRAELREADLGVTVVFFIITQRAARSLDPDTLHRHGLLRELRDVCDHITDDIGERLFRKAAAGERVQLDSLVDEYWRLRFRRTQHAMRSDAPPPVVTHVLDDADRDPVLAHIRALGLANAAGDPVKVVYHPAFIAPTNPLWGIEYDQFVRGCHLGIFPSAYEPWGYTPLECVAMGVPAVTSDLAGFGRYVAETMPDHDDWGVRVLRRRGRTFHQAAGDLTAMLLEFCKLDRRGRVRLRNEVERRSWEFDWSILGRAYDWAHDLAMARGGKG